MSATASASATASRRKAALARSLDETPTSFGASRFNAWRRCRREHALRYEHGIFPKEVPSYFGIGRLCHSVIAYVQEGALVGERFPWRDVLEAASDDPRSKPEVLDEVERLMAAYFAFWGEENAGWQEEARIIKIENKLEVAADVLGPLPYTARADCMLEIGGTIVVPDHKTRSRSIPDGEKRDKFLKQKQTNPQFLGLSYLVQKTYELDEPPDILLNAIVKTKIPKFQRVRVRFSQAQIDRWAKAQARDARDLDFEPVRPLDLVPMNYVSCAPELGAPCSYFDFCHAKSEAAAWKHFEIAGDFGDPESEEE